MTRTSWLLIFGVVVTITAGLFLWRLAPAAQIYPPHAQWHSTVSMGYFSASQVAFAVPAGVDLTITDITYDSPGWDSQFFGFHDGEVNLTVSDGSQNPNPTNFSPPNPVTLVTPPVSDSATFRMWMQDNGWPVEDKHCDVETISHHFQTGLFIPSGNTVVVSIAVTGGAPNFPPTPYIVHLNGRLN